MPSRRRPLTMQNMHNRTRPVVRHYIALEDEIFRQMAMTFRYGKDVSNPNMLEYQLQRMNDLHRIESATIKKLSEASGRAEKDIIAAMVANGGDVIHDTDYFIKQAGLRVGPVADIRRLVDSYIRQAFLEVNNYVNETLISSTFGKGSLAVMYRDILSDITLNFSAGHLTLDQAIEQVIFRWIDKGVPSSFIDRGGHRWSMRNYVETVMRSTNARIYNDLRTSRMAENGMYLVLMSSKLSARDACAPIQGKVLDISPDRKKPRYPNVYDYGYGTPAGTRGINCGHMWYPFREGVSENNQVQYDADEAMEMEKLNQHRNRLIREKDKLQQKVDAARILDSEKLPQMRQQLKAKRSQLKAFEERWKNMRQEFYSHSTS